MEVATPRRPRAGRFRLLAAHPRSRLALVLALILIPAGFWAWWAWQLRGLPDIGDPFDVEAFQVDRIADERNAFVEYGEAAGLHRAIWQKYIADKTAQSLTTLPTSWAEASPNWRNYLAQAPEALQIWRAGTDKPDALYEHPEGLRFRTVLFVTQELRGLAFLGLLEGMRRESEGDVAGAWGWYRAAFRASRHTGHHGFQVERMTGAAIHREVVKVITRWATNPKVDAPLLRRALDETIAINGMTAPRSESIKVEYLLFIHELDNPNLIDDALVSKDFPDDPADWCQDLPISNASKKPIQAARVIISQDRERSLRLARLMTANWLSEVDKPPSQRAKLFSTEPPIYEVAPASSPALSAARLSSWLDSSLLAIRQFRRLNRFAWVYDHERNRQARLEVHLATELYRREHGQPPASPQALIGPYLKVLPEGYDAVDEPPKTVR